MDYRIYLLQKLKVLRNLLLEYHFLNQFDSIMKLILYSMRAIIFIASKIYLEELASSNWKVCLEAKFSSSLR